MILLVRRSKIQDQIGDRYALYEQSEVQTLLSAFLTGKMIEIKPLIDSGGVLRFPFVEKLLSLSPDDTELLLNRLTDEKILIQRPMQRVMCCPNCKDSSNVFIRHLCPNCKSNDLIVEKTIQHFACGNEVKISVSNTFGRVLCEKCLSPIVGDGDYKVLGISLFCNGCGMANSEVIQSYFCSNCNSDFSLANSIYLDIYSYRLNKRFVQEVQQRMIIPLLSKTLSDKEFVVQTPGYLSSKSGSTYSFNLIAIKSQIMVAFDIIQSDGPIGIQLLLPTVFKVAEHRSIRVFLIAMPGLDDEARATAKKAGMICIEGTMSNILDNNASVLREHIEELQQINSNTKV